MDSSFLYYAIYCLIGYWVYKTFFKEDDYFKKRGVNKMGESLSVKGLYKSIRGLEDGMTPVQRTYDSLKDEKVYGAYMFTRPIIILKDADLIKQVLIKEFDSFMNHDSVLTNSSDAIFGKSLLLLENNPWREMRNTLSPIFTSARMKSMYHYLTACANDLSIFLDNTIKSDGRLIIDAKEMFGKYTAEAISSTALGFKANCIQKDESEVYKIANSINEDFTGLNGLLKMIAFGVAPGIMKFFNVLIFRQSTHDFFKKYVTDEIKRREEKEITNANDVIQMLIQAKNGQLKHDIGEADDGVESNKGSIEGKHLDWSDDELIAAQVFIFFAGGFETTSTLMNICSWELAVNQDIQKELIQEIDEVLETLNGKSVPYETLNKMKMLDMIVMETLRKWPPLPFGGRYCNRDCTIKTSDGDLISFKKGDVVQFPSRCIQHDPKYFENPSKFDPYRFSDENKHKIIPGTFLAFGYGPRVCPGQRLALLEAKLLLFTVLSKYTIEVCEKTVDEVKYGASPMQFRDTIFVELKPRV